MNMKVHWVYPALNTKNINIACIQGIPWGVFMVNSGNFMNLRHTGNSLVFSWHIQGIPWGFFFHGEFWEFHEFKAQWFSCVPYKLKQTFK